MEYIKTFEKYQFDGNAKYALPYKKIMPLLKKLNKINPDIIYGYPVGFLGGQSKYGNFKEALNGLREYAKDDIFVYVWDVDVPGLIGNEQKKLSHGKISDIINFANNELNEPIKTISLSVTKPDIEDGNDYLMKNKLI